jgi:hypothetical protein
MTWTQGDRLSFRVRFSSLACISPGVSQRLRPDCCDGPFELGADSSHLRSGIWDSCIRAGRRLPYLAVRRLGFLFNPSDFDPSVQHMLFGPGVPTIKIEQASTAEQSQQAPDAAA